MHDGNIMLQHTTLEEKKNEKNEGQVGVQGLGQGDVEKRTSILLNF